MSSETMEERGAICTRTLDDGRVLDVSPLMWGMAQLGVILPEDAGLHIYSDVWHYETVYGAALALQNWDGAGEPSGWHRHPATGRRRPGGDPAKEFVRE